MDIVFANAGLSFVPSAELFVGLLANEKQGWGCGRTEAYDWSLGLGIGKASGSSFFHGTLHGWIPKTTALTLSSVSALSSDCI